MFIIKFNVYYSTRMTTSISSEARRNLTSILIRGREKPDGQTDRHKDIRTDISIYRVASLLIIPKDTKLSLEFFFDRVMYGLMSAPQG